MNKIQYIYFIYIPNEVCSCEILIDVGMRGCWVPFSCKGIDQFYQLMNVIKCD